MWECECVVPAVAQLLCFVCCFVLADALYDGRLYRCDIRFSGQQQLTDNDNGALSDDLGKRESDEDSAGWEEREASRTHSVKFTDDVEENKEVGIYYYSDNSEHSDSGWEECEYCGRSHYSNYQCKHCFYLCCKCGRSLWEWLGTCFGLMGGARLRKAESYYMMYSELEAKDAL